MIKTKDGVTNDDITAAKTLALEVLNSTRERDDAHGKWFPNGIDGLSLSVSVGKDGVQVGLTLSGPKPSPGDTALAFTIPHALDTEQRVMAAAKTAAQDAANLKDCNKFVKVVANAVGIPIDPAADADAIVESIQSAPWTLLPLGDNKAAMAKAAEGKLVLAGLKKNEFKTPHSHGHVAVVHGHAVAGHPGFPHASWGSLDGTGAQAGTFDGSIRDTFPLSDLSKIHYGFRDI